MVLIDGRASVAQVIRSARDSPADKVLKILANLRAQDFIALGSGGPYGAIDPGDFFSVTRPLELPQNASLAHPEVGKGVSSLQDKGYYVRIARPVAAERHGKRKRDGGKRSALVIEDDPHIARLLKMYLAYENFEVSVATQRSEIVAAFGREGVVDIVLLDVTLPDVDGFDVLSRMRQHPVLKDVPVIMLTAKATREAVLKGLHCGADGYVTKPFEVEVVMSAVNTVLGSART